MQPPANTLYCPQERLTRGQIAVFLTRALGLTPTDAPDPVITLDVLPRESWGAQAADTSLMQITRLRG